MPGLNGRKLVKVQRCAATVTGQCNQKPGCLPWTSDFICPSRARRRWWQNHTLIDRPDLLNPLRRIERFSFNRVFQKLYVFLQQSEVAKLKNW